MLTGVRAQLAVSTLIVFGLLLIGLGFVGVPYVSTSEDSVVVQTSSLRTVKAEDATWSALTETNTVEVVSTTRLTTTITETYPTTTTSLRTLAHMDRMTITTGSALVLGPFEVNPPATIAVSWSSDDRLEVYTASAKTLGNRSGWILLGDGPNGLNSFSSTEPGPIYFVISPSAEPAVLNFLRVLANETMKTHGEEVKAVVLETTVRTTLPMSTTRTVSYTTLLTTTVVEYFTLAVKTTLTETRYADLSFMTVMGSFLVFVGLLVMMLLLRAVGRPLDKST
ncbi:MAG: hypothetical protein QXJ73_03770 [Candidatus Caldarchaeum sp.]